MSILELCSCIKLENYCTVNTSKVDTIVKCKAHVALGDTTSTVFNTTMFCKNLNLCYVGTWIVCSVISALAMLQVLCGPGSDVCLLCAKIKGMVVVCQGNMVLLS